MSEPSQTTACASTETEPTVAMTTVPMWLIVSTLALLFFGGWYFDLRSGWFESKVYTPYVSLANLEQFQPPKSGEEWRPRGKALFESNCALCHNTDGSGKPGQAPPLAGSEWVLTAGVNRLIHIPQVGLAGPIKVLNQEWNLNMAPMGAIYTDEQLADVLSYIRNSFGNKASVVTPEQVKKVRADIGGRAQPYTAEELMKLEE
jgi:mono/diheme cytochrome c family protein